MLRGIRTASANWLGRIVMGVVLGLIAISFTIWGIGDIFRGFGRSSLARIGDTEIQIEQFRQLYNDRLQQLARQLGRQLSLDQARALGLDRQIVAQLFAEVTIDERVKMLKLGVSDAEIARRITNDPVFQGPNGRFDRVRFEQMIRQAGFTEQRFLADQRRQTLRRQLITTILQGSTLPPVAIEAAERYRNEQRAIDYVLLDRSQAGEIPAPTPEVLAKYFEERRILFRAPEYRRLVLLALLPGEHSRFITISDDDLKRAFEDRRARYATPERRTLQQIGFKRADDAQAAADKIAKGASFLDIAKEHGLGEKDIDLGTLTRSAIVDRAIADAAFAVKEGEVTAPVTGRFGVVLVRVVKVEPEQVRPFEEVAPELRKELVTERAKAEIFPLYDKIEDERSIGQNLTELAKKFNLTVRTVEVDRNGRDADGKQISIPDAQRLLAAAFAADAGVENDPLQFEGGYVWYEVAGTTPARDRNLDEVRKEVEDRWRQDEIATRLRTKAAEMLEKLKAGTPLAEVAAAGKLKVETRTEIKRGAATAPLSERTIDAIFRTAKDGFASAEAETAGEQVVFRVTDIVLPEASGDSEERKRLVEALNRSYADDVFGQYLAQVERQVGVTINQTALRQVVTGQSAAEN